MCRISVGPQLNHPPLPFPTHNPTFSLFFILNILKGELGQFSMSFWKIIFRVTRFLVHRCSRFDVKNASNEWLEGRPHTCTAAFCLISIDLTALDAAWYVLHPCALHSQHHRGITTPVCTLVSLPLDRESLARVEHQSRRLREGLTWSCMLGSQPHLSALTRAAAC